MKKFISLLVVLFLVANLSIMAYASSTTYLGTLSYWYSNESIIGKWDLTYLPGYAQKLNSNLNFYFIFGMIEACDQWDDVTGIDLSSHTESAYQSSALQFIGGTRSEINSAGGDVTVGIFETGATTIRYDPIDENAGYWLYNSSQKIEKRVVSATCAIVDNGSTTDQYRHACTHELGHAVGWLGHSSNNNDVMCAFKTSIYTLTSRDTNHLSQIY